ncbi:MAG: hypothetical protein JSW06_00165 [Thermoplasmatales archaeon]|nr:MAG: hypothetical protein JSW06_00165 [Thermoplasmatales archaeon]
MYVMNSKGGKILLGNKAGGKMKINKKLCRVFVIFFALVMTLNFSLLMEKVCAASEQPEDAAGYWSFDEGSGGIAYDYS